MSANRILLLCLAAIALLAMPGAAAQQVGIQNPNQSTPVTLYMHLDGIQDFPINTQPPDDRYQTSEAFGSATNSLGCVPEVPGANVASKEWHTYYGYSTPGYVEYDFEEEGGPRYHKERGISFDVELDTGSPFMLYWYLETQAVSGEAGAADPNTVPVVVPNVVVRATMRTGDDVGVGDAAFNSGSIIAQGQTEPITLSPEASNHVAVGEHHAYEFAVPMAFSMDRITRDEAFNIRIDVYMDNPACDDPDAGYIMPNTVRLHTSPELRPRMDFAIMNPIVINYIHPQFVGDELVIHTEMNSPWGNYDVDEEGDGILVSVEGPSNAASLARAAFVQRHHEHFFHQEPVAVTYLWPYLNDGAKDGTYTVKVEAWNDQRTAKAVGVAGFDIGRNVGIADDGSEVESINTGPSEKESPGVAPIMAAIALVGAAAFVARGRRHE